MADRFTEPQMAAELDRIPGWMGNSNNFISKTFKFGDHIEAMGFVTRVARAAEVANHHPNLRIVYDTVDIRLSTHDADGVTERDIELAGKIDGFA